MGAIDSDSFASRSRAVDLTGVDLDAVRRAPPPPEALRTLRYMQDIESHTIIYLRTLLHTGAIDDPAVAHFLSCWFHEEIAHGRALEKLLTAAGAGVVQRQRSQTPLAERLEQVATGFVARAWPDFVAVHMTWGAINELTVIHAYQRLATRADHPVLSELLARLVRDESRHFDFYFHQASERLRRPGAARVARFLVERFWQPVGSGVQPADEVRFVGEYLFGGPAGRAAARKIDETIRRLPGFEDAYLLERWLNSRPARPRAAAVQRNLLPA
jgi:hypothetical protein